MANLGLDAAAPVLPVPVEDTLDAVPVPVCVPFDETDVAVADLEEVLDPVFVEPDEVPVDEPHRVA